MKGITWKEGKAVYWRYDTELMRIEPYGQNSFRVRITKEPDFSPRDWALIEVTEIEPEIKISENGFTIANGNLMAKMDEFGALSFYKTSGELLFEEQWQTRDDPTNHIPLMYYGHEIRRHLGERLSKCTLRLEAYEGEKFFGLGQHQISNLDLKGCRFELAQRNSQATIPFVVSNRGYGFFWNNPGYGSVTFANNMTEWIAEASTDIDYWVTTEETPAQIVSRYTEVTGRAPEFPEWAAGFWQCKLRYKTQDELLSIAREYVKRGIPLSVIVIDFFHWPEQGDWKFDKKNWPNPKAMVEELHSMGIELMVSVWPTVEPHSENYAEMKAKGYLIQSDRGVRTNYVCLGAPVHYDAMNPGARAFVWNRIKENYLDPYGIRMFWLDETEPEYKIYDFYNYRHYLGSSMEVGNYYPVAAAQGFYEGMIQSGIKDVINLTRCAWAGCQKYGVVLWSGDIQSNFKMLKLQIKAGLNAAVSGMAWWTTDIGGFYGGDTQSASFRELLVRWFEYGVFCPVLRLHGHRKPLDAPSGEVEEVADSGLFDVEACGPNEIWSFGEENYEILKNMVFLRERLRPYVMNAMDKAHKTGLPPMRPLFMDFAEDTVSWNIEDEYMFGDDLLVAPIMNEGARSRTVYLPLGRSWVNVYTKERFDGGQTIECEAPLEYIPVFASDMKLLDIFEIMTEIRKKED